MANRWGIPKQVEEIVLQRDRNCIYCGVQFIEADQNRKTRRTWEHIINDIRINGPENIALCCGSCNASKGNKTLQEWLTSKYCESKKIEAHTIAQVAKTYLVNVTTA